MITCACCGAELTMPSFKDGLPYGYSCYRKLFGKGTRPIQYVQVECKVIQRKWADLKSSLSAEGWEMKKDHFTIKYCYSFKTVSKKMLGVSEFALQDSQGHFWIPKNELVASIKTVLKKLGMTQTDLSTEFK